MLVWSDKITFGKYKGNTLTEIYKKDFNYLKWLVTKIEVSPLWEPISKNTMDLFNLFLKNFMIFIF